MRLVSRTYQRIRNHFYRLLMRFPKLVKCNVCNWEGRQFSSDSWHPHTICPKCGAQVRHRLLLATLKSIENSTGDSLATGKEVLHFAPETELARAFSQPAKTYVTADFLRKGVDLNLDMCEMSSVADSSFDTVVACDVLEHVEDDGKAMDELHRILRPGGHAILTVPQKDNLPTTFEDSSITSEKGRLEAFGQEDHLRIYGDDFPGILEKHGFEVSVYSEREFTEEEVRKHVLFPPILSPHPLATNYRKIFIAQKP